MTIIEAVATTAYYSSSLVERRRIVEGVEVVLALEELAPSLTAARSREGMRQGKASRVR